MLITPREVDLREVVQAIFYIARPASVGTDVGMRADGDSRQAGEGVGRIILAAGP